MHEIVTWTLSSRYTPKGIQRLADKHCREFSDNHLPCESIRFSDRIMPSYEDAKAWVETNDSGWYDCMAIKYRDKDRKQHWLVKIEYHV